MPGALTWESIGLLVNPVTRALLPMRLVLSPSTPSEGGSMLVFQYIRGPRSPGTA